MTYEEKQEKFLAKLKNIRLALRSERTPLDEIPLKFSLGSSSHTPEQEVQFQTSDIVLWVKFLDKWFRPYGQFNQEQIEKMVEICDNDNQVVSLMELLSANRLDNE